MWLSRPCLYGIRALTYLAELPPGKLIGVREIAQHEHIPAPFLSKVLLNLRRCDLLQSRRGTGGGFSLMTPPEQITLLMIVTCLEGDKVFTRCLLEDQLCARLGCCALHEGWLGIRGQIVHFFEESTLAQIAASRQLKTQASPDSRGAS